MASILALNGCPGLVDHYTTHFLTRKLNGVSAEMSLNVLAYNLKRVMKIIGTEGLLKAMTA